MKVIYKRMDKLKACITETHMYLYIPNEKPKICKIVDNVQQHSILLNCEDITKAEFEAGINNANTFKYALFKVIYLADVETMLGKILNIEATSDNDSLTKSLDFSC